MELQRIGVVGAGNIGVGVATDLILHGPSTVVVDVSEQILQRARAEVLDNVRYAPLLSKSLPRMTKLQAQQHLVLTTSLQEAAACDLVIENVTEDWDTKHRVYQELDRMAPAEV